MPSDKTMLHTLVESDLVERIDDFRFAHRFPSRASAMKYLLNWALESKPVPSVVDRERWS